MLLNVHAARAVRTYGHGSIIPSRYLLDTGVWCSRPSGRQRMSVTTEPKSMTGRHVCGGLSAWGFLGTFSLG